MQTKEQTLQELISSLQASRAYREQQEAFWRQQAEQPKLINAGQPR